LDLLYRKNAAFELAQELLDAGIVLDLTA